MFSIAVNCCTKSVDVTTRQTVKKIAHATDIIIGIALIIIGSLAITGIIPGITHVAPSAVLITVGAVNLMIGSCFANKIRQNYYEIIS